VGLAVTVTFLYLETRGLNLAGNTQCKVFKLVLCLDHIISYYHSLKFFF